MRCDNIQIKFVEYVKHFLILNYHEKPHIFSLRWVSRWCSRPTSEQNICELKLPTKHVTLPKFHSSPLKSCPKNREVVFQPPIFRGYMLNFRGCKLFNRKLYDHQVCQGRGSYACGSLFPSDWPCLTRIIRRGLSRSLSFIFLRFKVGNSSCHQETWGFTCLQDELASFFQEAGPLWQCAFLMISLLRCPLL